MDNKKKVVLLVDDSILLLERMIPLLEETPNIEFVVHAGTYKEASSILDYLRPDVILLDIHLPDKSGISLLELVRKNYERIIVFVMTNQASEQYKDKCEQLGAQRFFDKSADFDRITEALSATA